MSELELKVGRTYRAKKPRPVPGDYAPLVNDRTIKWIGAFEVQYDGPAVSMGRHYPKVSHEQFRKWADRDVTDELPPDSYADWPPARAALSSPAACPVEAPIPMVLHCPKCGKQHIDAPAEHDDLKQYTNPATPWTNPPHRSHLCHGCGHVWRPADVPTTGVAAVQTKGKADSPIASPGGVEQMRAEEWAELYRLREAVKGPDGFATWQEAASAERVRRVKAERALAASPAVQPQPDPIRELIAVHQTLIDEGNHYAYFELARTRQTDWMAWLTDRPARGEPGTAEYAKSRKVIARGQGETAEEACADALAALAPPTTQPQDQTTGDAP